MKNPLILNNVNLFSVDTLVAYHRLFNILVVMNPSNSITIQKEFQLKTNLKDEKLCGSARFMCSFQDAISHDLNTALHDDQCQSVNIQKHGGPNHTIYPVDIYKEKEELHRRN